MKTLTTFVLLCMLLPAGLAVAQEPEFICGTEMSETQNKQLFKQLLLTNNDGQFLTANGTLKILVVFAEFENHAEEEGPSYWPDGGFPSFVNSYIDNTVTQNSTHKLNITNYFSQMSQGNYEVIGDVKTVHVPNNYVNNRSGANQWVLNHLDNEVDYSEYDNWKKNADFIHTNNPDGIVDMIVVIYRGRSVSTSWNGEASLGFSSIMVDNNSTEIKGSYHYGYISNEPTKGSGVTAQAVTNNPEYDMISVTHEISHWLLGPHPYPGNGPILSRYPSMLQGSWYYASSTNAYEAERLGWITPTVIDSSIGDVSGLELDDFLTTGDAVKIKVTGGGADEYYLLENRQHVSIYDNATQNSADNGLFIHHVRGHYSSSHDDFRMIPSFGNWDWTTDGTATVSGSTVSVMKKDAPNRSGLSYHEPLPGVSGDEWMHAYRDDDNNLFTGGIFRGKDVISSYNVNDKPLFAANTNPHSLTWSGAPTDIAVKVVDEDQGKITVDTYMNYDPYTITENTTWDGQIFLEQTANIENNATLTILPGTTVYLSENVIVRIRPGAKIIAEGTEQEPIHFKRADPDKEWNKIDLRSSAGNSFEWVVFDGGNKNIEIASKNNTFKHITSRNGWRGISGWHNQDGSGNASADISYALIEDNTSVGIVSHYLDLDMSYTTIRNNAQAGLYISSNTVYPFHHNIVTDNGQVQTSRDGIEVSSSGILYLQAGNLGRGYNEIYNNPDDQISGSGDMYLGMLYPGGGGFNSIRGNYSGSKYLVDNNSGVTVEARENHWGSSAPVSAMFDGNVNYSYYQSTNPTSGSGNGHDGQAPSKVASDGMDFMAAYEEAEDVLEKAQTTQEVRDRLYRLYQLSGVSGEEELKGRFNQFISKASTGANRVFTSDTHQKTLQNSAMILQAKSLVRDKKYEELAGYLDKAKASALKGMDRRDWLHLTAVSQTYHGNFKQALNTIEAYKAHQKAQGVSVEEYEQVHQYLEEDIRARLKEARDKGQRSKELHDTEGKEEELVLQNYPNPFNPTTTIRFSLPGRSQVSLVVYDMLGREVATLVNEALPAGEQSVRFDASNLSNGVYIYKLRAGSRQITRKMTLIK